MPKPSEFDKGRSLSKEEYKKRLQKYYKEKGKQKYIDKAYGKLQNQCVDKVLFGIIKQQAKKKFEVYPSSYASAWIKNQYKKRGGKLRNNQEGKLIHTIPSSPKAAVGKLREPTEEERRQYEEGKSAGQLFFNTKDSNLYTVEEETNERKIVERRGDAKEGDLWVHPNTGNLKMKVGDKWVTVNDPNQLPKVNKQKVQKELTVAFSEKRKEEKTKAKKVIIEEKPKISRGQFLYKYKSPQNFYSWQDLAREHINCKHRSKQYIYEAPAYYLKDDLCNALINTNIDNLSLTEKPNVVNPNFFLLNSNNINDIKYSYIECHSWDKDNDYKDLLVNPKYRFDVYVNFVIEPGKIYYYAFNWKNLKIFKILQFTEVADEVIKEHFKTVVNLLLLMNQQPDIITEEYIPSKIVPLQKKYKVQSDIKPRAICWVGKDFTTRVVKLKPKQNENILVISGNTRKVRPHWRRGHWHTVLKGKNRKERKMRWYQPVFVIGNQAA